MKVCLVGYQTQSQGFGLGKDKSVDKIQIHANLLKFVISLHSANFDILYLGEFCLDLNLVVDESSLVGVSKWRNWGGGPVIFLSKHQCCGAGAGRSRYFLVGAGVKMWRQKHFLLLFSLFLYEKEPEPVKKKYLGPETVKKGPAPQHC